MAGIKGRKPSSTGASSGWYAPDDAADGSLFYKDPTTGLFLPLTPGTSGHVLKSNGAGAAPSYQAESGVGGGGGGLTLLESHSASASASLDCTTRNAAGQSGATFQSDFDDYLIKCLSLVPASNGASVLFRVSTDGGSTFVSAGGSYLWGGDFWVNNASAAQGSDSDTSITLCFSVSSTASVGGACGSFEIVNPLDSAAQMRIDAAFHCASTTNGGKASVQKYGGAYSANTAVNAFRVLMSTGNIASGTVRVYGLAK